MASNPYKNKVVYNGATLIDLTADTVVSNRLVNGYTAHDASGAPITGSVPERSSEDLTIFEGNIVQVPWGFYSQGASKAIPQVSFPAPSLTYNLATGEVTATSTLEAGYISGGSKSSTGQLPTVTGTTVTPSEEEQIVAKKGNFLIGSDIKVEPIPHIADLRTMLSEYDITDGTEDMAGICIKVAAFFYAVKNGGYAYDASLLESDSFHIKTDDGYTLKGSSIISYK